MDWTADIGMIRHPDKCGMRPKSGSGTMRYAHAPTTTGNGLAVNGTVCTTSFVIVRDTTAIHLLTRIRGPEMGGKNRERAQRNNLDRSDGGRKRAINPTVGKGEFLLDLLPLISLLVEKREACEWIR